MKVIGYAQRELERMHRAEVNSRHRQKKVEYTGGWRNKHYGADDAPYEYHEDQSKYVKYERKTPLPLDKLFK